MIALGMNIVLMAWTMSSVENEMMKASRPGGTQRKRFGILAASTVGILICLVYGSYHDIRSLFLGAFLLLAQLYPFS